MCRRQTLPRETIYLAQTPQAFRRDVLRDALALARDGIDATDEATLAERAGHPVRLVEGEASNIKITTPEDLPVAEAIAPRGRPAAGVAPARAGTGYDLHRLVAGPAARARRRDDSVRARRARPLRRRRRLPRGDRRDSRRGGLGDIGRHFPDTDPRWKDASSLDLLRRAVGARRRAGLRGRQRRRHRDARAPEDSRRTSTRCARPLPARSASTSTRVSIKGKTNEGVDAVGRGEAIAAHAVALLRSSSRKPSSRTRCHRT